ncbi:hypothetical protein Trydic_g17132 [Trypoxylus dichotomus]
MARKNIPIDGKQQKALILYFQTQDEIEVKRKSFRASRRCLSRIKIQFNLKNIKIRREFVSGNDIASASLPEELQRIIAEKGYHPHVDKMPQRTYIHKTAKRAPGFKAIKDILTLELCTNAGGVPIFMQSSHKAWVTAILSTEWFHRCFFLEVKRYLEKEGLLFKALLITNNAPGHPESLVTEDENIQVIFLPPNTTSLLEPLNQGIIRRFKAIYTQQVFDMLYTMTEDSSDVGLLEY